MQVEMPEGQTLVDIFLQSCSTPEAVREFLAHVSPSISTTAINNATNNLTKKSNQWMKKCGQTFLTLYAYYDNLDIDLQHSVLTVENSNSTLIHLTSVIMLLLNHGVSLQHLDCSDELWNQLCTPQ